MCLFTFTIPRAVNPYRSYMLLACAHLCMQVGLPLYTSLGISSKKKHLQGKDDDFNALIQDMKKQQELMVHHMKGSQSAKARFEAMLSAV